MATTEAPVAGLPDLGTLAQLANQFFQALPGAPVPAAAGTAAGGTPHLPLPASGGVPVPANPQPAGLSLPPGVLGPATPSAVPAGAIPPGANLVPHSPQSPANVAAQGPALLPHAQAPNGSPDIVLTGAPAYDGKLGSQAIGVPLGGPSSHGVPTGAPPSLGAPTGTPAGLPAGGLSRRPSAHGVAPALPSPAGAGAGAGSPFYFLDVASPAAGTGRSVDPLADPLGLDAQSHGLPGFGLPRLPAEPRAAAPAVAPPPAGSPYYFADFASPAARGAQDTPAVPQAGHPPFDVQAVRRDFPILQERVNGRPLVWFDNAATTHKPQSVIDRIAYFYAHENSNIHRAAHELAARATDAYERARETVRRFIGAGSVDEIIFVRGTTEAINLVAKSWGAQNIGAGDEIIVSNLEHHANIVPWQQLCQARGAKLRVIPVDESGQVLLDEYQQLLNDRTKLVSVTQVSNALGTVVPVQAIVDIAHRRGVRTLVDGAQSVSHMRVDVRQLDTDFFVFSGHKIFGPTGIGVVYGKREVLEDMPPWQGGGNMIADVTFEKTVYHGPPTRFEAGTGNIADAVGLGAALEYVERLGIENIGRYEHALLEYATAHMQPIPGVRLVGTAKDKASVLSFVLAGYSTDEVGQALNQEGIAVRTGHHCAQPILRRYGLETTVRPSLAFYNTCEEVDRMVAVVKRLASVRR